MLHGCRYLSLKERNLLLTEMAWARVPKDLHEQRMRDIPRGSPVEYNAFRKRYEEVRGGEGWVGHSSTDSPFHCCPCTTMARAKQRRLQEMHRREKRWGGGRQRSAGRSKSIWPSSSSACTRAWACMQVQKTLGAIRQVLAERVEGEADLRLQREMRMVLEAR